MLDAVTDDGVKALAHEPVEKAKAGDMAAIKEFLDRTIGKPAAASGFDTADAMPRRPIAEIVETFQRVRSLTAAALLLRTNGQGRCYNRS